MSSADELADLVATAIQTAEQCGKDVADVPLVTIARAVGVSRSTLVRRLNGSRQALNDAVRAAGIDPGGRPVRTRAIEAGAWLISERGLANVTLDAVAEAADCSVHSLYAIFGARDELFAAIYERYSPFHDVLAHQRRPLRKPGADGGGLLPHDVCHAHPRAARGYRDAVGRARQSARHRCPDLRQVFPARAGLRRRLAAAHVQAGRIRDIPIPLLMQQLLGPVLAHILMRPALAGEVDLDQACSEFTAAFLRAVGTSNDPDKEGNGG